MPRKRRPSIGKISTNARHTRLKRRNETAEETERRRVSDRIRHYISRTYLSMPSEDTKESMQVNIVPKVCKVESMLGSPTNIDNIAKQTTPLQNFEDDPVEMRNNECSVLYKLLSGQSSQDEQNMEEESHRKVARRGAQRIRECRAQMRALDAASVTAPVTNAADIPIQTAPKQNFEDDRVEMRNNERSVLYKLLSGQSSQVEQNMEEESHREVARRGAQRIRECRAQMRALDAGPVTINVEDIPVQTVSKQNFEDQVEMRQRSLLCEYLSQPSSQDEQITEDIHQPLVVQDGVHQRHFPSTSTVEIPYKIQYVRKNSKRVTPTEWAAYLKRVMDPSHSMLITQMCKAQKRAELKEHLQTVQIEMSNARQSFAAEKAQFEKKLSLLSKTHNYINLALKNTDVMDCATTECVQESLHEQPVYQNVLISNNYAETNASNTDTAPIMPMMMTSLTTKQASNELLDKTHELLEQNCKGLQQHLKLIKTKLTMPENGLSGKEDKLQQVYSVVTDTYNTIESILTHFYMHLDATESPHSLVEYMQQNLHEQVANQNPPTRNHQGAIKCEINGVNDEESTDDMETDDSIDIKIEPETILW